MKDKRLEHMKEDYSQIKIPEALGAKVEDAMSRAKQEMQAAPGKKKKTVWPIRIAGAAVAAMLVITVLANSSADVAYAMEKIPLLGSIVEIVTFRNYERNDNTMEAKIKVPEVRVETPQGELNEETTEDLNKSIQEYTDELIAMYEADVENNGGEGNESVNLDYTVITDNDKLFSIRFDQLIVMASGAEFVRIYHVDKTTGEVIHLSGLFREGADYISIISGNIKEQMKARMAEDENVFYWVDSEDITDDDFTEIKEDVTFYVNEAGHLVVVFDEYEVAPGYMGSQEFEIPTGILQNIVKEGYLEP